MSDRVLKIIMQGEIGVGKTSITRRLVFGTFDASYKATIGVDIYSYALRKQATGLPRDVNLLIWDIDGDFEHSIFDHIYSEGANAALIVADVTRPVTQKTALSLASGFEREFPGRPAMLVMNKIDLLLGGAGPHFAPPPATGIEIVWTSAKSGERIAEAFTELTRLCFTRGIA